MVPRAGGGVATWAVHGWRGAPWEEQVRKPSKTERADDIRAKVPGTQEVITCK